MTTQSLYVIYAKSKLNRSPRTYLDHEGHPTTLRIDAVTFYTEFDARMFARKLSINLHTGASSIDKEEFPHSEEPFIWTHI